MTTQQSAPAGRTTLGSAPAQAPIRATLGLLLLAAAWPAGAEDLDRLMPQPVPSLVEPERQAAAVETFRQTQLGAQPGETRLLDTLRGVVLLEDAAQLRPIDAVDAPFSAPPRWDSAAMRAIAEGFIGLPVSRESLDRLMLSIRFQLSSEGSPFSLVYTPPQDITAGVVQIVIRRSFAGEIRVEGAEHFSAESYLSRIRQRPGEPIDATALREDIERINSNPFRAAVSRVEKGSEPATTDIVIQARERSPLRPFIGYNNNGNASTTDNRLVAGVNWGNAFGLGHVATLQWSSDTRAEHLKSVSGNYLIDLAEGRSLSFSGAYSRIHGITGASFNQEGKSWQLSADYRLPLGTPRAGESHSLTLGMDIKSSDNNLDLTLANFIIPITDNLTHVIQLRGQYQGVWDDTGGTTVLTTRLTASPGGLDGKNQDAAFDATRRHATADYVYANLDLSRDNRLGGMLQGWNWKLRGALQLSTANLLGSEQFSAAGSNAVRGYEENEVVGDNALLLSHELVLPAVAPFGGDSLRGYLFQDAARTWSVKELAGETPYTLHSAGLGLRYQYAAHVSAQLAYGWQLRDSGNNTRSDDRRAHVSLQVSW